MAHKRPLFSPLPEVKPISLSTTTELRFFQFSKRVYSSSLTFFFPSLRKYNISITNTRAATHHSPQCLSYSLSKHWVCHQGNQTQANIMSGPGYYKFRCKNFYTYNCGNWVWMNNLACPECVVSTILPQPGFFIVTRRLLIVRDIVGGQRKHGRILRGLTVQS